MSNNDRIGGNTFSILTDQDVVKDWKKAFEPIKEEEGISLERPDVEAIIAAQPPIIQEANPPPQNYTGLCSGCIRPERGLCPCNGNGGVNLNPSDVNTNNAVRPFGAHELFSG